MPRFVLLYHDCPPGYTRPSHWDLMLEAGDVLETWALFELPRDWHTAHTKTIARSPNCPPLASGNSVSAEHLAGHRLAYLDFEGPINGGRGDVFRVADGTFSLFLHADKVWDLMIEVGSILSGGFMLKRIASEGGTWLLTSRQQPRSGDSA